jgi:hypothetical protein
MSEPTAPEADSAAPQVDQDGLPDDAVMRRAEEKPPLYRYVRGSVYVAYMLVVVWFVLGVVLAAYRSVWSPEGDALRAQEQQQALKTPEKLR